MLVAVAVSVGTAEDVVRTAVATAVAYAVVLLVLRTSGKRTLAKLNAFDLVITVALGSVLASGITSGEIPLLTTATALAGLALLQWAVARGSTRARWVRKAVRGAPALLVRDGELLRAAMDANRITEGEVMQVLRQAGRDGPAGVAAVVLETDGSLSVIADVGGDPRALRDVPGWDREG